MNESKACWYHQLKQPHWIFALLLSLTSLIYVFYRDTEWGVFLALVGLAAMLLLIVRPGAAMHRHTVDEAFPKKTLSTVLVLILTISLCVLPMNDLPLWNGDIPGHRNQYELMAENLLAGRIYFDYGEEDQLADLENPYDPQERKEAGVYFHWDHAYYNGRYYMYFGIVPVLTVFLPYRLLTGDPLTTYRATQLFAAVTILGIFAVFQMLSKLFFKKMPHSVCLGLSVAFSVMSVWYSSAEPALYCTAITSALAFEVWSLYFFMRAVWKEESENRQILCGAIGALLGALAFGCRPSIALANIAVIPMLVVYLRKKNITPALVGKLILAALPYAVVAFGLMCYNSVRFGDPFEFGQAYQLTVSDQTSYSFNLDMNMLVRIVNGTSTMLFGETVHSTTFPYLNHGGAVFNFPILFLTVLCLNANARKLLKEHRLSWLMIGLIVSVLVIAAVDIMWTPYILDRYYMDFYFLLGILCFLGIGAWYETNSEKHNKYLNTVLFGFIGITVVCSFLFYTETVGVYYPDEVKKMAEIVQFWKK